MNGRYTKRELIKMTVYELQKICNREKLVKGYTKFNDRESLINIILRYRGLEERLFINNLSYENYFKLQEYFLECESTKLKDINVEVPAKIQLYKGLGVTVNDNYRIKSSGLEEGNALVVDPKNKYIYGVFNLVRVENRKDEFYLLGDKSLFRFNEVWKKSYEIIFLNKKSSDYLYKVVNEENELSLMALEYNNVIIPEIEIRELEKTSSVLCIDFGTSNTALGVYLDENYIESLPSNLILNNQIKLNDINFVKFKDVSREKEKIVEIVPSLIYVRNILSDGVEYLYGYEAQKRIKSKDYITMATTFREIKRWVGNYNKEEEIQDENSNILKVKRGEIIRSFLKYVINEAESQFKCRFKNLHLTTPVKLSNQYIKMFKELLYDYEIEEKETLNEGMAVLYNTIFSQISKNNFDDDEEYKGLVIDSGGGTTDLSSCSYRINEGEISYNVSIKTGFENGDTNFGGNNITYRIMQFMKIILSNYYKEEKLLTIDDLISYSEGDIFRVIDDCGINKVYEKLEDEYIKAENIVPTRYREYENRTLDEYKKVKNNFYFLWELSEMMKKDFFQKTNILRNKFESISQDEKESDMQITQLNRWNLSVARKERLELIEEFPEVIFNVKEIIKLIKGDIYEVIRKFLEPYYENKELTEYSIIKLSGQSSKIDIFKEAIKEFVPGRSIEFKQKNNENSFELKLACLRGVINYINNKRNGRIVMEIRNDIPVVPYSIVSHTFTGEEKELFEGQRRLDKLTGYISRPISAREIKFYLKDIEGKVKRQYIYKNDLSGLEAIKVEELEEKYKGYINQEDTDNMKNGEIRYFIVSEEESWGFYVVPIIRKEEQLYINRSKFFDFDYEIDEYDFFNGLK
ncbi:molecular chaperone [Haliovirga abyssi]|uniref:Molecular chaperone n=1 Tax=Haliovirga abyssi TaxID=2996794 RepID=A0AAU9DL26_9FUSO|nr:molecular chaperone [Haliovirga abyssi]BDU50622.1 hypothetical protein HLVA_11910 [Haliovirga abyssi]